MALRQMLGHEWTPQRSVAPHGQSLPMFFLLVFVLSVPFWLIGAYTGLQLFPGLPVSALAVVCPSAAALVVVAWEDGDAGVRQLLRRACDCARIKQWVWYAPIILIAPGVTFATYGVMHLMGAPLPRPQFSLLAFSFMVVVFFVGALLEELGWSGCATDRMRTRWAPLQVGIILGTVWAAWHVVPLVQAHRSPDWIAGSCLFTVASRVIMVWLYENTGRSVFGAIVYHDVSNVSWLTFPNFGSHYDPRIAGAIMALVAAAVVTGWRRGARARCRGVRAGPPAA